MKARRKLGTLAITLVCALAASTAPLPVRAAEWDPGSVQAADDFERPGPEVGNGWTFVGGDWQIQGGKLTETQPNTDPNERLARWSGQTLASAASAELTFTTLPHSGFTAWSGVAFNVQDDPDGGLQFYLVRVKPVTTDSHQQQTLLVTRFGTPAMQMQLLDQHNRSGDPVNGLRLEVANPGSSPYLTVKSTDNQDRSVTYTVRTPGSTPLVGGNVGVYSLAGSVAASRIDVSSDMDLVAVDSFDRAGPAIGNGWAVEGGDWTIENGNLLENGSNVDPNERLAFWSDLELGGTFMVKTTLRILPHSGFNAWNGLAVNVQGDPVHGGQTFYLLRVKRLGDNLLQHQTLYVTGFGTPNMAIELLYQQNLPWVATGDLELAVACHPSRCVTMAASCSVTMGG